MEELLEERCRKLIKERKYDACLKEIEGAMSDRPHEAVPHNLMGILMETQKQHDLAMKHFRAAYALNPAYIPARYNMELCGQSYISGEMAFVEKDCPVKNTKMFKIVYDEHHIGRLVRQ